MPDELTAEERSQLAYKREVEARLRALNEVLGRAERRLRNDPNNVFLAFLWDMHWRELNILTEIVGDLNFGDGWSILGQDAYYDLDDGQAPDDWDPMQYD